MFERGSHRTRVTDKLHFILLHKENVVKYLLNLFDKIEVSRGFLMDAEDNIKIVTS